MKTASELLNGNYFRPDTEHCSSCICDRCKKGKETFLVESDIAFIQSDARLDLEQENQQLRQEKMELERKAKALDWLRNKPIHKVVSVIQDDGDGKDLLSAIERAIEKEKSE
jgi:hypothetical protein